MIATGLRVKIGSHLRFQAEMISLPFWKLVCLGHVRYLVLPDGKVQTPQKLGHPTTRRMPRLRFHILDVSTPLGVTRHALTARASRALHRSFHRIANGTGRV